LENFFRRLENRSVRRATLVENELKAIVDQTSRRFPRDRAAKATTTTKRKLKPTNAAMMGCISTIFSFEDCDRAAPLGKSITAEAPGVI